MFCFEYFINTTYLPPPSSHSLICGKLFLVVEQGIMLMTKK